MFRKNLTTAETKQTEQRGNPRLPQVASKSFHIGLRPKRKSKSAGLDLTSTAFGAWMEGADV